ncbi:MAG TPA: DUF5916 domain-containing protein [Vicinamibacteria bacterium]|nr:DUF5916 domain-containing protein [Vicinamibacteria bacterium]
MPVAPRAIPWLVLSILCLVPGALAQDEGGKNSTTPPVVIHGPPPPEPPAVLSRDDRGRVTIRATRIAEPIVLDGKLDELLYRQVPPVNGFVQQEPNEGAPATEDTDAWIFFDDENVYISARCWDSHPERMIANEMRRDHRNIFQNENFTIVLDTFYDRRNGFFFQTNPLGALRDQEVGDEGNQNNNDWNTVWHVRASKFDRGWVLEVAIPFKSLRYKEGRDQIWGINLKRSVRWKNEESFISPVAASHRFRGVYRFSEAATLVGIQAPLSSRNLELKPYGISSVVTDKEAEPQQLNDFGAAVGFDLKYGLTKSLIADFTYNTDFAQVEEDEQQVNLTRFSLFFPEKREVFLEGQSIFAFGGVQQQGNFGNRPGGQNEEVTPIMFFSRSIGLTEDGEDPIIAGGRVTGRTGPFRIGALNIQTEGIEGTSVDPTNSSVFRLRRDILSRSDIGVIATHRTTSLTEGASANSLAGVDANFAFFQNLKLNTYYAVSRTPLVETEASLGGSEVSYLGRLDYGGDRYGLQLEHLKVGESFRPELGFVRREAFERSFVQGRFSPRPSSIDWVRRFTFQGELDYITGEPTGIVETRRIQGRFETELESGGEASFEYNHQYEFLPEEFEIYEGIFLPVGSYEFQDILLAYRFGAQFAVPGFVSFRTGSFFDGDRQEFAYSGRIEVSPKLSIEPRTSLSIVDLVEGSFTATLVSSRVNFTLSPRTAISALVQYNSSDDTMTSSARLRWEYEPGSDLFVVYTDGRDTSFGGFPAIASRTFAVKFTKLFRF